MILEIIRFKDWGNVRIFNDHRPNPDVPHREGTASEIKEFLDDGWEISLATPNLAVLAKEIAGKWHFKMFEKVVALLLLLLATSGYSQTVHEVVGEIINVDTSTKTITLYDTTPNNERMFEIAVGPKNWERFGHIVNEGDTLVATYQHRLNPTDYVPLYLLWKVKKLIRPIVIYERCVICSE